MKPRAIFRHGLFIFVLVSLLVSACVPYDEPVEQGAETPQAVEELPLGSFKNTPKQRNMPFEMLFDPTQWTKGQGSEGLTSSTIPDCQFGAIQGGTGDTEGPFDLKLGDKNFYYRVERLTAEQAPTAAVSYLIYYQPTEPEFQREDLQWAFSMKTSAESEQACFEAVQPILETLIISLPERKTADHLLNWDETLAEKYCSASTEGRLFTIAERDGKLILSSGEDLDSLYLLDPITNEKTLLVQSAFEGGVIQPPLQIDGDYLVYLDSENYMLTRRWSITAYNFETGESKILLSREDYPSAMTMLVFFDVEDGPVYVSIVEGPDFGITYTSSILEIDIESGVKKEIYSLNSEQVRIGRLSVNGNVLVAEQVAISKDVDPYQPMIMIKLKPSNALQDFKLVGWNPLLTEEHLVFAHGNQNQFPTSVTVSDIWGEDRSDLELLGENIIIQYLNGNYLSWQASGGPEAPTTGIYLANVESMETYNLVSHAENTALILPIIIRDKLHFGMVTGFMSPEEKSHLCAMPMAELLELTAGDPAAQSLLTGITVHPTGLTLETIPLKQSGLFDDKVFGQIIPLDEAQADRLKPSLPEFGGYAPAPEEQDFGIGTEDLYAVEEIPGNDADGVPMTVVRVIKDGEEVFTVDTGRVGSNSSLQNFLVLENGKWVLEVVTNFPAYGDRTEAYRESSVYYDGDSLNDIFYADEVFNYRFLGGKEFFFVRKGDQLSYVYNGKEVILPFDVIQHNLCCGYSIYNPTNYQNVITFYATAGDQEYYVILGIQIQ